MTDQSEGPTGGPEGVSGDAAQRSPGPAGPGPAGPGPDRVRRSRGERPARVGPVGHSGAGGTAAAGPGVELPVRARGGDRVLADRRRRRCCRRRRGQRRGGPRPPPGRPLGQRPGDGARAGRVRSRAGWVRPWSPVARSGPAATGTTAGTDTSSRTSRPRPHRPPRPAPPAEDADGPTSTPRNPTATGPPETGSPALDWRAPVAVGHTVRVVQIQFPAELPVSARREEIAETIRDHQVVIVAGETGSGKTTQLPKICLALGRGQDGGDDRAHPAAPDRRAQRGRADRRGARHRARATWSATRCGSPTRRRRQAGSR